MSFFRDLRVAVRSLARVPALWITVAPHLGTGYRSQRRNLQRGTCGAAASAGKSRRRSVALPAPERSVAFPAKTTQRFRSLGDLVGHR